MMPEDVQALKSLVASQRATAEGYDIVLGGMPRGEDWEAERAHIRAVAEAGATWWLEYLPPDTGDLATVRACVERGPLRIE